MSAARTANTTRSHSLVDAGALATAALLGGVFILPYRLWLAWATPTVVPAHFELRMLVLSALIAVALPLLQIVLQIRRFGGAAVRGNRAGFPADDGMGGRVARAHRNLIESLVPFAAVAVAVDIFGATDAATAAAAALYLAARLVHAATYVLRITILRSAAYYAGVAATVTLIVHLPLPGMN